MKFRVISVFQTLFRCFAKPFLPYMRFVSVMASQNVNKDMEKTFYEFKDVLAGNPRFELVSKFIDDLLHRKATSDDEQKLKCKRFLEWSHSNKHLKVVTAEVPINILPNGRRGQLHDVKVFVKFGPDDPIYDKNKEIRDKVARGNCFLEFTHGPDRETSCVTYALKKFTGGLGDDDDKDKGDNHTWKRYFIKPLETATHVVCTRKANGEAAHFSARCIDGTYVLCTGSKNVHMLIRDRGDIERYTDFRFSIAKEVSNAIFDLLDQMTEENKDRLLAFLSYTGFTGIFEILNPTHQHVEDLSYLSSPQIQFIAWTSCELEPPGEVQLCSVAPHVAIELARSLGLPTVEYDVIPVTQVDERMAQIRRGFQYEGEVLYFIDIDNTVIGLLKKKTIWYIICRAIREKLRNSGRAWQKCPADFDLGKAITKVEKRIMDIREWLNLDKDSTLAWTALGVGCLKWCLDRMEKGLLTHKEAADMFPVTWKTYLEDTGNTDQITVVWEEPDNSDQ